MYNSPTLRIANSIRYFVAYPHRMLYYLVSPKTAGKSKRAIHSAIPGIPAAETSTR